MAIINSVDMPNFTHREIPPDIAQYMDRLLLARVQQFRNILKCPFNISRAGGALIRFGGRDSSHHRVIIDPVSKKVKKLSGAIDGFPDCDIFEAWTNVISSNLFGGIGVYFDTKNNHGEPQPMLHLDMRGRPLIWYRYRGVYYYPHKSERFFKNLIILLGGGSLNEVVDGECPGINLCEMFTQGECNECCGHYPPELTQTIIQK